MAEKNSKDVILLESNGNHSYFSSVQLQATLLNCFMQAGLQENCYLAEDIALAVEYALVHGAHARTLFSRMELDAVVIQILSDTGMADVAAIYRLGANSVMAVDCVVDEITILTVLRKFMVGEESHLELLSQRVKESMDLLRISSSSPGLIVELARHYEEEMLSSKVATQDDGEFLQLAEDIAIEDIAERLSVECRNLLEIGVLDVQQVNSIFPCIKLGCNLVKYADFKKYVPPVTELILSADIFDLSRYLEELRSRTLGVYEERFKDRDFPLPCYLNLPDISSFVEQYFEVLHWQSATLSNDIAAMLQVAFKVKIEHINMG